MQHAANVGPCDARDESRQHCRMKERVMRERERKRERESNEIVGERKRKKEREEDRN